MSNYQLHMSCGSSQHLSSGEVQQMAFPHDDTTPIQPYRNIWDVTRWPGSPEDWTDLYNLEEAAQALSTKPLLSQDGRRSRLPSIPSDDGGSTPLCGKRQSNSPSLRSNHPQKSFWPKEACTEMADASRICNPTVPQALNMWDVEEPYQSEQLRPSQDSKGLGSVACLEPEQRGSSWACTGGSFHEPTDLITTVILFASRHLRDQASTKVAELLQMYMEGVEMGILEYDEVFTSDLLLIPGKFGKLPLFQTREAWLRSSALGTDELCCL